MEGARNTWRSDTDTKPCSKTGRKRLSCENWASVRQYNIKIYFEETGYVGADWIHLAQDKDQWWVLSNTALNLPSFQTLTRW
jgi:hypothetical protein